jgi:hypothetical protein
MLVCELSCWGVSGLIDWTQSVSLGATSLQRAFDGTGTLDERYCRDRRIVRAAGSSCARSRNSCIHLTAGDRLRSERVKHGCSAGPVTLGQ